MVESCSSAGLVMKVFLLSASCDGASQSSTQPVGQCLQSATGSYFENECSLLRSATMVGDQTLHSVDVYPAAFAAYKASFAKVYAEDEEPQRLAAFRESIARVRSNGNPAH